MHQKGMLRMAGNKVSLLEGLIKLERMLKLRYLGLGFVWAWIYCSYSTSAIFSQRAGVSINTDTTWLASAVVVIVAFVVGGIILRNHTFEAFTPLHALAPALLAVGTLLSGYASEVGTGFVAVSGFLTGAGVALLSLLWADALRRLSVEELEIVIPLIPLATVICALIFPYLEGFVGLIATASLPVISGVLLYLALRDPDHDETEAPAENICTAPREATTTSREAVHGRTFLLRIAVLLCVSYLVIGWVSAMSAPEDGIQASIGIDVAAIVSNSASVVFAVVFVLFTRKVDFASLYRWITPLLVVSVALRGFSGGMVDFLSSVIVGTCDTFLQVLVYLYIIRQAKSGLLSVAFGVGVTQGCVQLGVLAGNMLGSWTNQVGITDDEYTITVVLVLICILVLTSVLTPQREYATKGLALSSSDSDALLAQACTQIAGMYQLSNREAEIAFYLAKGRSQPYIRESLMISKNTVATHVKHIYQKLGIHSREELIDLVDTAKNAT